MKKLYLLLLLVASSFHSQAQCSSPALPGTNANSTLGRAPSGQYMSIRTVYLITPTEMATGGFLNGQALTEIGWSNNTLPAAATSGNLNILLSNTTDAVYSKTTDWVTATAGMTSYRNATTTLPAVIGDFSIPLTTSFNYTGGGVYVAFEWTNCGTPIAAVTINCNNTLAGLYNVRSAITCTHSTAMGASSFRPATTFSSAIANDAKVTYIYNQGELVVGKSATVPFGANITNLSGSAFANMPVTLTISGANTFTTTATITSLAACSTSFVSFPGTYTPTNEGTDIVTISIPPDANNANNSLQVSAEVGKDFLSYKNVGELSTGGGGFNTGTGTLAIQFSTAVPTFVTHAKLNFNTVTTPSQYRVAIYSDNLGVPSTTALYTDAALRTNATGEQIVKLDNAVSLPAGTFYLGIIQESAALNLASGFITETPVRANTFFFSSNPPATWTDFNAASFNAKMLSGVQLCYPYAPNQLLGATSGCEGAPVLIRADTVGRPDATSFTWVLPSGYTGTSTTDSIYVTPNAAVVGDIKCVANYPCGPSDTVLLTFTPTALSPALAQSNMGNTMSTAGTQSQTYYHSDGDFLTYSSTACNPMALVIDFPGANVLGTTTTSVTVDNTVSTYNGQPYCRRHFTITPTNNGSATVQLFYSQADFNDYNLAAGLWPQMPTSGSNSDPNIANIRITKVDGALGTGPATIFTPNVNWNGNFWEVTVAINNFSTFYLHAVNPNNQVLPITWNNINVRKENNHSLINWSTASESNNHFFTIEHSVDGRNFNAIGQVNSKGINGNSTTTLDYQYMHDAPVIGHNYYRIMQTDFDKKTSYSAVRDLVWNASGSSYTIYPQPIHNNLNIDAVMDQDAQLSMHITDMSGRIVHTKVYDATKGLNHIELNVSHLSQGNYLIRIGENNKSYITQKIIVAH